MARHEKLTPFPKIPEIPEMPKMPEISMEPLSHVDLKEWQKEWQKSVDNWENEVQKYQYEQNLWFNEKYDTKTYVDENGYDVTESVSKDGKHRMIMKTKSTGNGNIKSRTIIWLNGQKVHESERESTQYTVSKREKESNGSCLVTLIIFSIIIVVIFGVIKFF